ncbi:MAG: ATP-binding protein [Candidatus Margulisiibacteriota bacterium]|jgi:PAS domain S-box-containing protein
MILSLKESRENLITEKERSEAIIANIPEGIIVTDKENRLILANQKAEQMFNFTLSESKEKFILECINNPELLETIKDQVSNPSKVFAKEIIMENDKNKPLYFILTFSLAQNQDNEFIGVITVLRDITHDKELEELRDSFLRTVSHELRTPLTSIIGFIDLILQGIAGSINKEQNNYLTITLKQALYLKDLINNLLDLSKIEAGKIRMLFAEIDVAWLIKDVVKSLEPVITERKEKIQVIIKPVSAIVMADIEKLRRILINLITNAIKFTDEGSIMISVEETEDEVIFSVKDTGIGLNEDECKNIFDKFFQVDSSSTRSYEGLGLGLPIAKELVELHNGKIWVESAYMRGSNFKFSIPKKN